mmetsp:Transcript_6720/g.11320  ORF Transcript_6720/g.11320 Transcript_6720/m.11320 type:complete len:259 (-) Transcript_6720:1393-2169(-)
MIAEQNLHKGKVRSGQLHIRDHVADRDLETHLQRHVEGVLQGLIVVQCEDSEVHVVARKRVGQSIEHEANALVLLEVDVLLHRHLQDPAAVGAHDRTGLAEQQNAVGAGVLKENAHAFVGDELLHELEQCGHHGGIIVPGLRHATQQRKGAGVQRIEQQVVRTFVVGGRGDAAQVPQRRDDRQLHRGHAQVRCLAELRHDLQIRREEGIEGVVQIFRRGEHQSTQRAIESDAVFIVVVIAQEREMCADVVVHEEVHGL